MRHFETRLDDHLIPRKNEIEVQRAGGVRCAALAPERLLNCQKRGEQIAGGESPSPRWRPRSNKGSGPRPPRRRAMSRSSPKCGNWRGGRELRGGKCDRRRRGCRDYCRWRWLREPRAITLQRATCRRPIGRAGRARLHVGSANCWCYRLHPSGREDDIAGAGAVGAAAEEVLAAGERLVEEPLLLETSRRGSPSAATVARVGKRVNPGASSARRTLPPHPGPR